MEGASASSHHDPVSPGADTTLHDATEDEVVIVEGEAATSSKRKADQRPLVGSPFDIALFRELQSEVDNPFMESKRELKNRAWDELATWLHRVKTGTCTGKLLGDYVGRKDTAAGEGCKCIDHSDYGSVGTCSQEDAGPLSIRRYFIRV